jgi:hypothetical protein
MTDYSAAVERLQASLDADTQAALRVIDWHRTRFIADCIEAGLSPEDAEIEHLIDGDPTANYSANHISTTSGGSAGCRSVRTKPGGIEAWISARVSATNT